MPYLDETTWNDHCNAAAAGCRQMIEALNRGLEQYNAWQTFRAARDNATIATALGKTEAEIADLDAGFSALKELHDFASNVASPTQGDRFYSMRHFR